MKRLILVTKAGILGPVGSGRQWWSWVHLDDVTGFIIHLLEGGGQGAFNLVSPDARRQRDWVKTMGQVFHRPSVVPAPAFAVRAVLGGFSSELLESRHMIPAATLATGYEFAYPDLEPALKQLAAE